MMPNDFVVDDHVGRGIAFIPHASMAIEKHRILFRSGSISMTPYNEMRLVNRLQELRCETRAGCRVM